MYKDFKKSESLDTGFVGGSGIIWMFSGVVLGLLVGFGIYHFSSNNASALSMTGTVENKIKQAQIAGRKSVPQNIATTSAQTKPKIQYKTNADINETQEKRTHKFNYYAMLPKINVPVDSSRPINTSPEKKLMAAKPAPIAKLEEPLIDEAIEKRKKFKKENIGDYLLQVASYRKKSSANITRGRLSKSGINSYVQEKKVKGRMWFRVIAGPVDQKNISGWKHTVEKMGHHPLVISVR